MFAPGSLLVTVALYYTALGAGDLDQLASSAYR